MTLIGTDYIYAAANDAYCQAHQKQREELVGHTVSAVWGEEAFLQAIKPNLDKCFTGQEVHYEAAFTLSNRQQLWYDVSYYPYRRDGLVTHAIVVTRDITGRKLTEVALRESEVHYRQLFNEARTMQESLRHLSNRILTVQEEERKRISHELHDEVGQALTAINLNLTILRNQGLAGPAISRLQDTQNLVTQTMETVHRFARELRPAILDDLGLLPALRSYVRSFSERTGLRVRFNAAEGAEQLDAECKTVVFRVVQESLNNVAKHACASAVEVNLRCRNNRVFLEIKDNGQSFRVPAPQAQKRLGLLGMQERVRLVDGVFSIQPQPGIGTTIRIEIPFPSQRLIAASPVNTLIANQLPNTRYAKNQSPIGR